MTTELAPSSSRRVLDVDDADRFQSVGGEEQEEEDDISAED